MKGRDEVNVIVIVSHKGFKINDCKVWEFPTDNPRKYPYHDLRNDFIENEIEHKLLVHTPQQNGVADWKN